MCEEKKDSLHSLNTLFRDLKQDSRDVDSISWNFNTEEALHLCETVIEAACRNASTAN